MTPESRAELRELAEDVYAAMVKRPVLLALLDAADERDLLAAAVERVREVAAERTEPPYAWESADGWSDGYDQAMEDVRRALSRV